MWNTPAQISSLLICEGGFEEDCFSVMNRVAYLGPENFYKPGRTAQPGHNSEFAMKRQE